MLRDLYEVSQPHATHWKEIGTLLGLHPGDLKIIEKDSVYKAEACCLAMLQKWMEVDPEASWPKWFKAFDQVLISGDNTETGIATYMIVCL